MQKKVKKLYFKAWCLELLTFSIHVYTRSNKPVSDQADREESWTGTWLMISKREVARCFVYERRAWVFSTILNQA